MCHLVFVDDQAKFSQETVGQAGSAQGGEQLPDGLLSSFPHTPTPSEQDGDGGLMEHPAEQHHRRRRSIIRQQWGWKTPAPSEANCRTHLELVLLSRWAWSRKSRSQSVSTVSRAAGGERREEAEEGSGPVV